MQGGITAATAVAVIKPASWADGIEALDRPQKAQVALLAETLLPFPHSNEPRHVGDPDQIKHRLTHELPIRLVDVDQDTGFASPGSIKTFIQSPHDGGLQHAEITLDVPGIGKWCLPRRWRGASQLAVKAFGHGLFNPGQLADERNACPKLNQSNRLEGLGGTGAGLDPAGNPAQCRTAGDKGQRKKRALDRLWPHS